uniref:Partial AB-hydrolase lipase domain-containing protein n=1 Tax=Timema shepardi TaxID=629360 RepID=A0A7R9APQ0_TIMSH|nr:unnamed protein product [Timema shepardi]
MQQQRLQGQTHRETPHRLSALAATSHTVKLNMKLERQPTSPPRRLHSATNSSVWTRTRDQKKTGIRPSQITSDVMMPLTHYLVRQERIINCKYETHSPLALRPVELNTTSALANYSTEVQLVRKEGYPVEEHQVTTQDGYQLTLHRIPSRNKNAPVVHLQHGFLGASDFWVITPRDKSLGTNNHPMVVSKGFTIRDVLSQRNVSILD